MGDFSWAELVAQGVVSGVVVLLGVLTQAAVTRRSDRRRRIEEQFLRLDPPMFIVWRGLVTSNHDVSDDSS